MEFLSPVFEALSSGADVILESIAGLALLYVSYVFGKGRLVDMIVKPVALDAVKAAQLEGKKLAAEGIEWLEGELNEAKLDFAKDFILQRVPNWLVSDKRLEQMIDAALVELGLTSAAFVTKAVVEVKKAIDSVKVPAEQPAE